MRNQSTAHVDRGGAGSRHLGWLELAGTLAPAGFDHRLDGVCIHRAGTVLYVCPVLADLVGLDASEDAVGGRVTDLFRAGSDRSRVAAAVTSTLPDRPSHLSALNVHTAAGRAVQVVLAVMITSDALPPIEVVYVRASSDRNDFACETHLRETHLGENELLMASRDGDRIKTRSGRPTVLICDDEARLGALTAGLLSEYGFAPITVGTGEEALAALAVREPQVDVLLLDVNLSAGSSAREVLVAMRERGTEARVILTSGLAEEDVDADLVTHPLVVGYVAKPYGVDQLVQSINKALARASA